MSAYPRDYCLRVYRSCYVDSIKCGVWVLTQEWELAQYTLREYTVVHKYMFASAYDFYLHMLIAGARPLIHHRRYFQSNLWYYSGCISWQFRELCTGWIQGRINSLQRVSALHGYSSRNENEGTCTMYMYMYSTAMHVHVGLIQWGIGEIFEVAGHTTHQSKCLTPLTVALWLECMCAWVGVCTCMCV